MWRSLSTGKRVRVPDMSDYISAAQYSLRAEYERNCKAIGEVLQVIEDNTEDYWILQNAIKAHNHELNIAYKDYMKALKQLRKEEANV